MEQRREFAVIWGYRWWLLVLTVAAAAGAYGLSSRAAPGYTASSLAQVVSSHQAVGEFVGEAELLHVTNVYAELARTDEVATLASRDPSIRASADTLKHAVKIAPEAEVEILRFTASADGAATAAAYANAYANAFSSYVDDVQNTQREKVLAQIEERVNSINDELTKVGPNSAAAAGLNAELEALQGRAAQETARPGDSIRIIQPAAVPSAPSSPKPKRDAVLGAMAALVLGAAAAFLRYRLTDRYGSSDEIAADLDLPVLGELSKAADDENFVEAVRALRINVAFALPAEGSSVLLVTSAEPKCGKTFVTENLARAFANDGRRVTAVDADLHRPTLHRQFGIALTPGLGNVLTPPGADIDAVAETVPLARTGRHLGGSLSLVAAGARVEDTAEALASRRMASAIERLGQTNDLVMLDTPPVLAKVDAVVLARQTSGVLFVVDARVSRRRDVHRAMQTLMAVQAPVIGIVFNRSARVKRDSYSYSSILRKDVEREDEQVS